MAAKEMYDYLSSVTADYVTTTLSVKPHNTMTETGSTRTNILLGDDGSEERIMLDTDPIFFVEMQWDALSASDAGTIIDFFLDSAKGAGNGRSFYWDHPTDGHSYTVRFDGDLKRFIMPPQNHGIATVRIKVLGKKP